MNQLYIGEHASHRMHRVGFTKILRGLQEPFKIYLAGHHQLEERIARQQFVRQQYARRS